MHTWTGRIIISVRKNKTKKQLYTILCKTLVKKEIYIYTYIHTYYHSTVVGHGGHTQAESSP